jgi:hypothetical protein
VARSVGGSVEVNEKHHFVLCRSCEARQGAPNIGWIRQRVQSMELYLNSWKDMRAKNMNEDTHHRTYGCAVNLTFEPNLILTAKAKIKQRPITCAYEVEFCFADAYFTHERRNLSGSIGWPDLILLAR